MSIRSWSGSRIVVVWLGAIVLAAVVVRVGDALRATGGNPSDSTWEASSCGSFGSRGF